MSFWEAFDAVSRLANEAADTLKYVVLDHSVPPGVTIEGRDSLHQLYVRVSPSIVDSFGYAQPGTPPPIHGVPIFRREDLPDNWGQSGEAV